MFSTNIEFIKIQQKEHHRRAAEIRLVCSLKKAKRLAMNRLVPFASSVVHFSEKA